MVKQHIDTKDFLGMKDFYGAYKAKMKSLKQKPLSKTIFRQILDDYCELTFQELLKGEEIRIPFLGKLRIIRRYLRQKRRDPLKSNCIDWKTSRLLGKRVGFLNLHSNGEYCAFSFARNHIVNIKYFKLIVAKKHKVALGKGIIGGDININIFPEIFIKPKSNQKIK